ncbi:MAG: nucleotidyl transferase AbiEii/AbiGii toxin family protein [Bacteroidia bacterium]
MAIPALEKFSLVGGTALSLQYGHRTSIDLDLFCNEKFDNEKIIAELESSFGKEFNYAKTSSLFGIFCFIEKIKVDLVHYPHPIISTPVSIDDIRMYSCDDIAAMKIQAILGRGKKKDFWDLAELFNHYSMDDIIQFHSNKYPSQQLLISIPYALTYFTDAEESDEPVSLKGQTWDEVKNIIQKKVSEYLR